MAVLPEDWTPYAKTLGYASEEEMLKDLYITQGFSAEDIATRLGFSRNNVRRRLTLLGVKFRARGGKNNLGNRSLADVTDEELLSNPFELAKAHDIHVSTVFKERYRRGLKCTSQQSHQRIVSRDTAPPDQDTERSNSVSLSNSLTGESISTTTDDELLQEIELYSTTEPTRENESESKSSAD